MSNIVCKDLPFFPLARQEVNETRNGAAVRCQRITQHKTEEAEVEGNAQQPTKANTQDHAVEERQNHTQLCVADALDKGAAAAHDRQRREQPKDRHDKCAGHFKNKGVIRKQHKQLLAKKHISCHEEHGQNSGVQPCEFHHLHSAFFLPCSNILTDHGHGRILYAHGYLIDNVVDANACAKGSRGNDADAVDHGIDKQHGNIDAAGLDSHWGTQGGNHL